MVTCHCQQCHVDRGDSMIRMFVCDICGNKRCPHATDHRLACTNSNDVGQEGSSFGTPLRSYERVFRLERKEGGLSVYVYIQSEPGLWTVGFYDPQGKFVPESDHNNTDSAATRVHWLNGGEVPT